MVLAACAAAVLLGGCQAARHPVRLLMALRPASEQDEVFAHLLEADGLVDPAPWNFYPPHRLRPCCAFGSGLSVRLGAMPIAGLRLDNVAAADDLGRHKFNSGVISLENEPSNAFISPEKNGLIYTCRGGFIDSAHVRDHADWMAYLFGTIRPLLRTGGTITLSKEGGRRYVRIAEISQELIDRIGDDRLALRIAQWVAIHLAIWHETATWYGWSSWGIFPEVASAFSPEDLYSNMVGIKLATELIKAKLVVNEATYNASMDAAMPEVLRRLGAAPKSITRSAMRAVDGLWWDSSRPLPDKEVVLRRSFNIGPEFHPWHIPEDAVDQEAAEQVWEYCYDYEDRPLTLRYETMVKEEPLRDMVGLDIELDRPFARRLEVTGPEGPWVSQEDFPELVGRARLESLAEFGDDSDQP